MYVHFFQNFVIFAATCQMYEVHVLHVKCYSSLWCTVLSFRPCFYQFLPVFTHVSTFLTVFTSVDVRLSVITHVSLFETHSQTHRQKCPHAKPSRPPIKKTRPLTHAQTCTKWVFLINAHRTRLLPVSPRHHYRGLERPARPLPWRPGPLLSVPTR